VFSAPATAGAYACSVSIPVPLEELAAELDRRSNAAYLLTVGDDGRSHCVESTVEWAGEELLVPAGRTSVRNAAARAHVVLLSPPRAGIAARSSDDDGYSLIVDAEVTGTSSGEGTTEGTTGSTVRARPTHAVLHRPAAAPAGGRGHDCVHVYDKT
jgi:hypothetical protein